MKVRTPELIGKALKAFMAPTCPNCDGPKARIKDAFCADCFGRLPAELSEAVADQGQFLDTFHPAMDFLKR